MSQRNRGPRRSTRWFDDTITTTHITGGTTLGAPLLNDLPAGDRAGLTVIRTMVSLHVTVAAQPGAFGTSMILMAEGTIADEAFASAALPDLNDDADYPMRGYIWKTSRLVPFNNITEAPAVADFILDIRSMRKLEQATDLVLYIANFAISGAGATMSISGLIRTLVKNP